MVEIPDRFASAAGEPDAGVPPRNPFAIGVRLLLPVVPAGVLCLLGWIPFWGGFLFFLVADLIRWGGTSAYMILARPQKIVRPMIEAGAFAISPLFALLVLILMPQSIFDRDVQSELVAAFMLCLCYLPYALVSFIVIRVINSRP
jgi:hypothetical protein